MPAKFLLVICKDFFEILV